MNILSVDLDIIMAPCINLYNSYIKDGKTVEDLIQEFPLMQGCQPDLKQYQKLVNYIVDCAKSVKASDIKAARSHEDIKYLLQGQKNVCVYNIDHHHDLGYPTDEPLPPDYLDCSNWGDYFIRNGVIQQYIWLKNKNSVVHPTYKNTSFNFETFNLRALPPMDKIFICLSPEWVPEAYHPLFYMILDLISKEKQTMIEVH